ncbi:hypothetical protein TFLX_01165 [Thermoflexales bacterium]|nr:hypothetical protein TFLX_01165 [Thermoflexales bacterium]
MVTPEPDSPEGSEFAGPIVWSSYLVRLWRETERDEWRGRVVHLQTQEARPCVTLAQIQEFLVRFAPGLEIQSGEDE